MNWFRVKNGRLEYCGRISRQPFLKWCATPDGRRTIARVSKEIRFSIFGRARTAQRRLWRPLHEASRTEAFTATLRAEPGHFMQAMAAACYADALPRAHVALGRLVLTPRAMVTGRARAEAFARLVGAPVLADVDEAVRTFLVDQIVFELDAALTSSCPAPKRPVHAHDGWACVGARLDTLWVDPLWAGPHGTGHLFMYELPQRRLTRREHKALELAIERISGSVATLSRLARENMLRAATLRRV